MQKTIECIAGGTASGKSTFTGRLEELLAGLKLHVFHMDSYFKPADVRPKAAAPITGKIYLDDNCPETIFHEKLREDLAREAQKDHDVILVEGLYALWYDWLYKQLDLKLFIDCLQFDEIAQVYLDMVRYRHVQYIEPTKWRADLILNGSTPSLLADEIIVEQIRRAVQ